MRLLTVLEGFPQRVSTISSILGSGNSSSGKALRSSRSTLGLNENPLWNKLGNVGGVVAGLSLLWMELCWVKTLKFVK